MRERTMPQIMAESCNRNVVDILVRDIKITLLLSELLHEFLGEVARANAMFESIVNCSWENVVHAAQLLKIAKPLELFCVNDVPTTQ